MDKGTDIPIGFGFALAQDPAAMRQFSTLPESQMAVYLQRARAASSKAEMQSLVSELSERKQTDPE